MRARPRETSVSQGEGRRPVVPLVFKTSLGAVRSSEGSTPSLLRQPAAGEAIAASRHPIAQQPAASHPWAGGGTIRSCAAIPPGTPRGQPSPRR
jgi:hypothetical protein